MKTQGTIIRRALGGSPDVFEALGNVTSFDGPGMSAPEIDDSTFDSTWAEKIVGIPDAGQVSLGVKWVSSGAQARLREDFGNGTIRAYQLELTDGTVITFSAYVTAVGPSGGMNSRVEGSITLSITGEPAGI